VTKSYDSKAILGVAYGYATGRPLSPQDFSGGVYGAAGVLRGLGFEIVNTRDRDPLNDRHRRLYDGAVSTSHRPEQDRARHFHRHVLADVDYLKSRGYNPTRFLTMIAREGSAVVVAKRLLSDSRQTSYGFERLWEMGELGRTVEFVANLPWFRDLLTRRGQVPAYRA
jgi:hypothetical protein